MNEAKISSKPNKSTYCNGNDAKYHETKEIKESLHKKYSFIIMKSGGLILCRKTIRWLF